MSTLPLRRGLVTIGSGILYLPLFIYFHDHVYQIMPVTGPSMSPFLNSEFDSSLQRDYLLVSMRPASTTLPALKRGSVVAFWSPRNPERMAVKRIIALPGDEVSETRHPYPFRKELVPQGCVWVEGDSPDPRKSLDSNTYGPVPVSLITGVVKASIWPRPCWVDWRDWKGSERVKMGVKAWEGGIFSR